jgi:hypothetical protein
MATPGSAPSTPAAVGANKLSIFFSGTAHAAGLNDIIANVLNAWNKIGYSESSAQDSPLANTVLTSLTNGKSKWATIVTAMLAANSVTQRPAVVAGTTTPTTTSGTAVALADPTLTLTTTGGDLDIEATMDASDTTAGAVLGFYVKLDSGAFQQIAESAAGVANSERATLTGIWRFTGVSAASHTITLGWATSAGTATSGGASRYLRVTEIKK